MPSLTLLLIWLAAGLLVGLLSLGARLTPASWGRLGWLWQLLLSLGAALLGGGLDTWLSGKLFASAAAFWVAALVSATPWLILKIRERQGPSARARSHQA